MKVSWVQCCFEPHWLLMYEQKQLKDSFKYLLLCSTIELYRFAMTRQRINGFTNFIFRSFFSFFLDLTFFNLLLVVLTACPSFITVVKCVLLAVSGLVFHYSISWMTIHEKNVLSVPINEQTQKQTIRLCKPSGNSQRLSDCWRGYTIMKVVEITC